MVKAVRILSAAFQSIMSELAIDEDTDDDEDIEQDEQDNAGDDYNITFHRLPCILHSIQLVMKTIDKQPSFQTTISKVRGIVRSVRVSSVITQKLVTKCGKTLIADCPTRWSSTLLMLNRLLECKASVIDVFTEQDMDCLLNTDWIKAEEIAHLLQPFADHTNTLQTNSASLASIVSVLVDITYDLKESSKGPRKVLAQCLLQALNTRFALFLQSTCTNFDPLPAAACLLEPDKQIASTLLAQEMDSLLQSAKAYIIGLVSHAGQSRTDEQQEPAFVENVVAYMQEPAGPSPQQQFKFLANNLTTSVSTQPHW